MRSVGTQSSRTLKGLEERASSIASQEYEIKVLFHLWCVVPCESKGEGSETHQSTPKGHCIQPLSRSAVSWESSTTGKRGLRKNMLHRLQKTLGFSQGGELWGGGKGG